MYHLVLLRFRAFFTIPGRQSEDWMQGCFSFWNPVDVLVNGDLVCGTEKHCFQLVDELNHLQLQPF